MCFCRVGSRKSRKLKQEKRLEERANSVSWKVVRKRKYAEMSESGILGSSELKKYDRMYSYLKGKMLEFDFPPTQTHPKRGDYDSIRVSYVEHGGVA